MLIVFTFQLWFLINRAEFKAPYVLCKNTFPPINSVGAMCALEKGGNWRVKKKGITNYEDTKQEIGEFWCKVILFLVDVVREPTLQTFFMTTQAWLDIYLQAFIFAVLQCNQKHKLFHYPCMEISICPSVQGTAVYFTLNSGHLQVIKIQTSGRCLSCMQS